MRLILLCLSLCLFAQAQAKTVPVLTVADTINAGVADYIENGIEQAAQDKAAFLIIQLDTEGGTLTATRQIVKSILNSEVPIVVFVTPKGGHATSAGTFITIAADIAAMSPGTHIGAAHPVMPSGEMDEVMNKKATNDTAAFAETIAKSKKRNTEWAKQAVIDSASITAKTALDNNVIDLIAEDLPDLLSKLSGYKLRAPRDNLTALPEETFSPNNQEMSLKHRLLSFFAHPQMALWILSLGGLCIWIELTHPGLIFPGVLGGLCVILSLISLQMLPIHYGALALLLFGMVLMVAEVFVTSYGVLGLGGVAAFIVGSLFLIDTDVPGFTITFLDILPIVLLLSGAIFGLAYLVLKSRKRKTQSGMESLLGEYAEVREVIEPGKQGKVFIFGELWKASTESENPIPPKSVVVVKEVRNMLLVVEPQSGRK